MADITSAASDGIHNVEAYVYQLVTRHTGMNVSNGTWPGLKVAVEMAKAFAPIHQAFIENKIGRKEMIEWLMQLEATPIEISEIIEMMEENRKIVYDARERRLKRIRNRPTGE